MRHILSRYFLAILFCSAALTETAAESPGFRHSLFDGKSLNGWTIENDCEVDVIDQCIRLKSGLGWLRYDSRVRDFELHVEWIALNMHDYDAGIFFRTPGIGKPFPQGGDQCNMLEGKEGNVPTLKGAESKGLAKGSFEWNTFDLKVVGETASLRINDKPAWTASGIQELDGWLGFQVEVPNGGQFLLRNIELTEFGYTSLFNGEDLTGWNVAGDGPSPAWKVEDGLIACSGVKGQSLRSDTAYGDYNLRLDYRAVRGTNSGIYIRIPEDGKHHRDDDTMPPAGLEIQVLDDTAPEHAVLKDFQYSASIYDFAGARQHVCKPLGEWNTLEINCLGQRITTWHNGILVAHVSAEQKPLLGLSLIHI